MNRFKKAARKGLMALVGVMVLTVALHPLKKYNIPVREDSEAALAMDRLCDSILTASLPDGYEVLRRSEPELVDDPFEKLSERAILQKRLEAFLEQTGEGDDTTSAHRLRLRIASMDDDPPVEKKKIYVRNVFLKLSDGSIHTAIQSMTEDMAESYFAGFYDTDKKTIEENNLK